jgi:hypothetical protein
MMKIARYLRGWVNYYGISEYYRPIPEIDHWLRRRVRMCYWKQWRYVRTRMPGVVGAGGENPRLPDSANLASECWLSTCISEVRIW